MSVRAQFSSPLHLGVKNGLPSAATFSAVQDRAGFMWIGTEAGLARYDGEHFKIFTKKDGLPDNDVLGLIMDTTTDRMWIITFSRSACYYRAGKIYTKANDSSLALIKCPYGEFIRGNISGDKVLLYNGSYIYECAHDSIIPLEHMATCTGLYQISYWGGGHYDILNEHGITANLADGTQRIYPAGGLDTSENGVWVNSQLFRFYNGKLITYTKEANGDYRRGAVVQLPVNERVTRLIPWQEKYLLYINKAGVYSLDRNFKSLQQIWAGHGSGSIALDRDGDLWITTGGDGVYVLRQDKATSYKHFPGAESSDVTAVTRLPGNGAVVGLADGHLCTISQGEIKALPYITKNKTWINDIVPLTRGYIMISDVIQMAYFSRSDALYRRTLAGGPRVAIKRKNGYEVLIGLIASIVVYDDKIDSFREVPLNKRIFDMAERSDGQVVVGSIDGLYLFQRDSLTHLTTTDSILNGRITSLCYTPDDVLWVGTPSDGIAAFVNGKVLGRISTSSDLRYHGAMCRKIVAGKRHEIWVVTNDGLNRITYHIADSLIIDRIIPYSTLDGLLSDDVNDIAVVDSMVYVATTGGLTILPDKNLYIGREVPMYITGIHIQDKDSAVHDTPYYLDHTQNNLRIEYTGICLPTSDNLKYQYRLLGAGNDNWTTTTNNSIELRSLSPGSYTFEVTALDKFGRRSGYVARVRFEITPAFYTTWWFWAIIMITILIIGFLIIRDRFRRQQERFQKEQSLHNKIIELEQQALKAQMNPHFIFNCLTAVQHFVNREDMYSANMYLSNFARLIRKTLDLSGEQYISLDEEIAYLQDYVLMECLRFGDKFTWQIDMADYIDSFEVQVPPMLLQPIVENAIRHGLRNLDDKAGRLLIDFAMKGSTLYCSVDDNGIGRQKARELKTTMHVEYQSKGMKLTEMRIHAINQISDKKIRMEVKDKYDSNNEPDGTLFILAIEQ